MILFEIKVAQRTSWKVLGDTAMARQNLKSRCCILLHCYREYCFPPLTESWNRSPLLYFGLASWQSVSLHWFVPSNDPVYWLCWRWLLMGLIRSSWRQKESLHWLQWILNQVLVKVQLMISKAGNTQPVSTLTSCEQEHVQDGRLGRGLRFVPSITNTDDLVSLSAVTANSTTGCLLSEGIHSPRSRKKCWREGGGASPAFVISRQRNAFLFNAEWTIKALESAGNAACSGSWSLASWWITNSRCGVLFTTHKAPSLTEGGLRRAREQTQLPIPKICITIVQIYGNAKIAHADAIPGSGPGEGRKRYRAATLSAPLSATWQTLPGEF